MWVDQIALDLQAGRGGPGAIRWSRRKYLPKGGPCGGNGGQGGSIYIRASEQITSLARWANARCQRAESGTSGGSEQSAGHSGNDLLLEVPCGTVIKDAQSALVLADLTEPGQQILICRGGRGGRGNATFATSTRQTPNIRTEGEEGQCRQVVLELQTPADVGLVGLANVGKSTLLNALTGARAQIGEYPFTTQSPNLGVLIGSLSRLTLIDLPGFNPLPGKDRSTCLRHLRRVSRILYVLDASSPEHPLDCQLRQLRECLAEGAKSWLKKSQLIAVNKIDCPGARERALRFAAQIKRKGCHPLLISARLHWDLRDLSSALMNDKISALDLAADSQSLNAPVASSAL